MELTKEVIESLAAPCKKDIKLSTMVAEALLAATEPVNVARLLLDKPTALKLLAERVRTDLAGVVAALSNGGRQGKKATRVAVKAPAQAALALVGRKQRRRRTRMTAGKIAQLGSAVLQFLKTHPASSRSDIQTNVPMPSPSAYLRTMQRLLQTKLIKQQGHRRLTTYSAK